MSVLDASALAEALTSATDLGAESRTRIARTTRWHAPAILPAEVLSAIRRMELAGVLSALRADQARRRLARTRITLHEFAPFAERIWELRTTMTVHDGWYVALAERLDTALVTTDGALARAPGSRCEIDLVVGT